MDVNQEPGSFEQLFRSLAKSHVRVNVLLFLGGRSDSDFSVSEIVRRVGGSPENVRGTLKGLASRYSTEQSLLALGLVSQIEKNRVFRYQITLKGIALVQWLKGSPGNEVPTVSLVSLEEAGNTVLRSRTDEGP